MASYNTGVLLKTLLAKATLSLFVAAAFAAPAGAATVDFNSLVGGIGYTTIIDGALTVTSSAPTFTVQDVGNALPLLGGNALLNINRGYGDTFRLDVAGGATFLSLNFGDYGADADTGYLVGYDAAGNELDSDSQFIAENVYGGGFLSVQAASGGPSIAYALFGSNGLYPSSVYVDNVTYAPAVPEPETYALLIAGLAGVSFVARRRAA
jgi:hypothetical protein